MRVLAFFFLYLATAPSYLLALQQATVEHFVGAEGGIGIRDSPISAIGLRGRYNERGDFLVSTTPALADDAAATSGELVFPHIVTGGGYTTEFLLLSRTGGASGTVLLRSQAGNDLPLPIIK